MGDEVRVVVGRVGRAAEAVGEVLGAAGLADVLEVVEERLAVLGEEHVRRLGVAVDDRLVLVGLEALVDRPRGEAEAALPSTPGCRLRTGVRAPLTERVA